jgi:hypothetical protein
VWWVTKECGKTRGDELKVLPGHFVKETASEKAVPKGYKVMVACSGAHRGLVPEDSLQKIELHDSVPAPGADDESLNTRKVWGQMFKEAVIC